VEDDDRAFVSAFEAMAAVALGMARKILADDPVVDDVAAEALARAYVHWDELAVAPYRDAWIARVAANLALSWRRRRLPWLTPRSSPSPDEGVTARIVVRDALGRLSRRQREVVALCLLADFTEAEAARAMGVSVGTVKTHLHRGRAALRTHIDPDSQEAFHAHA
jgi:RNA polymerase sigma-70 factor, ECF subfamily